MIGALLSFLLATCEHKSNMQLGPLVKLPSVLEEEGDEDNNQSERKDSEGGLQSSGAEEEQALLLLKSWSLEVERLLGRLQCAAGALQQLLHISSGS